jgi:hypothetical protein
MPPALSAEEEARLARLLDAEAIEGGEAKQP